MNYMKRDFLCQGEVPPFGAVEIVHQRDNLGAVLSLITIYGITFIDDNSLFFTGCLLITLMNGFKIILFGFWTRTNPPVSDYFFGYILFEAICLEIRILRIY